MLALMLCISATGCASIHYDKQDPWLARDKALHVLAGIATGVTGAGIAQSKGFPPCAAASGGVGLAFSVGLAKEWHDHRHGGGMASGRDLLATVIGGFIGAQLVAECHR